MQLSERKRKILKVIISDYILTAEPMLQDAGETARSISGAIARIIL